MITFFKKLLKTSLIVFILTAPLLVYAQSQMTVTLNPEAPGPYEKVVISIVSYSFDVNTAMVEWTVGNKVYASGLGVKKITLTLGAVGEAVPILVKVTAPSGEVIQTGMNLSPQSTDIVWESVESYIPAFYEGKALPGEGSHVRLTALPNMTNDGAVISPNNLSYLWYINDSYIDEQSGIGRQSAVIPLDILSDTTTIRVRVRSPNGSVAEKEVVLYPHATLPTLYLYDDILGTNYKKSIGGRFETTGNFTLSLVPYYLSIQKGSDSYTTIDWALDGLPITPIEKTLLSLQPKENSYGTKLLTVSVNNTKRLLQKALTTVEIVFDTRK